MYNVYVWNVLLLLDFILFFYTLLVDGRTLLLVNS